MMIVNLVFDWNGKVDDLHNIFYTLSAVESTCKSSFIQSIRFDSELYAVNMAQTV